uniref:Uncharacterized protein n=2 Tax=Cajanus cajan TaxID=3821 RepID=A0A151UGE6_CAJCA
MGRNDSTLISKSVPHIHEKCKDPGTFCIPCIIGNSKFENSMLDLGASINVMPLSIFKSLSLGPLQPTGVVIHLNRIERVEDEKILPIQDDFHDENLLTISIPSPTPWFANIVNYVVEEMSLLDPTSLPPP